MPDGYLAGLAGDELGHPGADPAMLAAELCGAGIWERAEGGYRVLDEEAVQVCVDRVRELREQDAWLAGLSDPARSEPAVGAAGTTRFGDRVPKGLGAASFRCGECGEVAGVVRLAHGSGTVSDEPSSGAGDWLVLKYFLGTVWHSDTSDVLDAVQALIDQGNVDPVLLRQVSWTLWDITPFYCPECRLNYCSLDWDVRFAVSEGSHDCIIGTCPNGHRHLLG